MPRTVKRGSSSKAIRQAGLSPKATYQEKAKLLRALGFKPAYGRPGGSLAHRKAALTRAIKHVHNYAKTEAPFVFVKAPARVTKKISTHENRTPGGLFVQRPANVAPKNFKAKITPKGELVTVVKTKRGGIRRDRIISINPDKFAADPAKAVSDLLAKTQRQPPCAAPARPMT